MTFVLIIVDVIDLCFILKHYICANYCCLLSCLEYPETGIENPLSGFDFLEKVLRPNWFKRFS
jgi:hypothetical protein